MHIISLVNIQKFILISIVFFLLNGCESPNKTYWELFSPDGTLKVTINNTLKNSIKLLSYHVERVKGDSLIELIGESPLGIVRNDNFFYKNLIFISQQRSNNIKDSYTLKSGKALQVEEVSNEITLQFKNANKQLIDVIFRTYNDGMAFRYHFPNKDTTKYEISGELSGFKIAQQKAWIQHYDKASQWGPAYEKVYENGISLKDQDIAPQGWCFPALFQTKNNWILLTEANLEVPNFAAHLTKQNATQTFSIALPLEGDAMGVGKSQITTTLPWSSPWRVAIIGASLGTVIESNLVTNLSKPNVLKDIDWIKPGRSSWSWWSSDWDAGRNLDSLKHFVDLSKKMHWKYSLVDANWNKMKDGELDSLVQYANSKQIGLLLWYNSGGKHNIVTEEPRDLMFDAVRRKAEFRRIHKLGIKGVKVDFFQSDKPFIIKQYLDILNDAAKEKLLVNFHGCTIPRGWRRTYPNLVSMESVMGAESYEFSEEFGAMSPMLNTIYAATRNVIGPMDYTPVTFSNRKYPHKTSYAHELALAVVFESGITHFADKVSAFENAPNYAQEFLKIVPVTWDEIKFLKGTPGKEIVIARRKGDTWYIGGINGENKTKNFTIQLSNFKAKDYDVKQLIDGETNTNFSYSNTKMSANESLSIKVLPYGGFVVLLKEI